VQSAIDRPAHPPLVTALPNGYFRRPRWKHSIREQLQPFNAAQEAVRELRLTFYCDDAALDPAEREAYRLLRNVARDTFIEWYDWRAHPPKWTLNEEGDQYTFQCYYDNGDVRSTALSDWIRRPMSDSEVLFMAHERFGQDVLVTTDEPLLKLSRATDNANILPPSLALPLVHLYLRTRGKFISDAGEIAQHVLNRGLFYLVALRSLLPELWPFMNAARRHNDKTTDLCDAIRSRCIRALQAQDELGRLFFGQRFSWDDSDRMGYHFEYATMLLLGAIDAQARVVNFFYGLGFAPHQVAYTRENFRTKLRAAGGGKICDLVESRPHYDFWVALRTIRNRIHGEALGGMGYESPASGDANLLTLSGADGATLFQKARQLGNPELMGVYPFDQQRILIEPFRCASFLVQHGFDFLRAVADATTFSVPKEPEHPSASEFFTDRALRNMKLFFAPVAVL
jgi:hypothetical protein